jgi:hypothetical protein
MVQPKRWKRDIRFLLSGMWGGMDWIDLAQDRDWWYVLLVIRDIGHGPQQQTKLAFIHGKSSTMEYRPTAGGS